MSKVRQVTVRKALGEYVRGADFQSRAVSVQREYARVADHLEAEIGDLPAASATRGQIRAWRDEWATLGHRAATIRLQVLKNALAPMMQDGELEAGLFTGLQRVNRPHGAPEQNPVWFDGEVEAVIEHCLATKAGGLARAVALGRYAGLRRQSICSIKESDRLIVTGANGQPERRLKFRSEKAEEGVDVREDPRLTELLDTTQSCGEILSFNKRGRPWAPRQLNQALTRVIAVLVELGEVRPDLTLHGLRHSRGVELAHAGATDAQLAAHLGHRDEQTAREYRRQASKRQLADGAQDMVDQTLRARKRSGGGADQT